MKMYPPEVYAQFQDAFAHASAVISAIIHDTPEQVSRFENRLAAACPFGSENRPVSHADMKQTAASFCRIMLAELEAH